jgi:hypothetical protein
VVLRAPVERTRAPAARSRSGSGTMEGVDTQSRLVQAPGAVYHRQTRKLL